MLAALGVSRSEPEWRGAVISWYLASLVRQTQKAAASPSAPHVRKRRHASGVAWSGDARGGGAEGPWRSARCPHGVRRLW